MRTIVMAIAVCGLAIGCSLEPNKEPKKEPFVLSEAERSEAKSKDGARGAVTPAPWLEGALRVAVVRADGKVRIVGGGVGWVRAFELDGAKVGERVGEGAVQVLEVIDVDGDGEGELVVGWGRGRGALEAPARVEVLRADLRGDPEVVPVMPSDRAQLVSIRGEPGVAGVLWIAQFESKYQVAIVRARRDRDGRWTGERETMARVATAAERWDLTGDGRPELVVARAYGERKEDDGFVYTVVDGQERRLGGLRGARALRRIPGTTSVVYADGWHFQYGTHASARITRGGLDGAELLAEIPGRHGYTELRTGDLDGDGAVDVVASGNGPAIAVPALGGRAYELGEGEAIDAYPADLDGDGVDEVVIAGTPAGIWRAPRAE